MLELNKIYCMDCLEGMRKIEGNSIDIIVTSPPYNNYRNRRTQKNRDDYWKRTNILLDPFMGSGTTALAAKELGRNYIGFDVSENYCRIAEERLRKNT